ncbi:hypothetical protein [Kineococcus terrestris]|uniref:hypothetical protein n=1 Tax=Kineococcus terrestris TaxID=2044856 RepID=UPI0034DB1555
MSAGWQRVDGGAPGGDGPRPGPVSDADDERLARSLRDVVAPVVRAVLRADEVEGVGLRWGAGGRGGDVWVRVDAPGDRFTDRLLSPWWEPDPSDVDPPASTAEVAEHLADRLQDWVAESAFGWGQLRPVDDLPLARMPSLADLRGG